MVIRPIIIQGCAQYRDTVRSLTISVIQRLRTGDTPLHTTSADFYCYNCLTFHRAENTVLSFAIIKKNDGMTEISKLNIKT